MAGGRQSLSLAVLEFFRASCLRKHADRQDGRHAYPGVANPIWGSATMGLLLLPLRLTGTQTQA